MGLCVRRALCLQSGSGAVRKRGHLSHGGRISRRRGGGRGLGLRWRRLPTLLLESALHWARRSKTPFADKIVDLCTYRSNAPGILMRHILEHNYDWEKILISAVRSFQQEICLGIFTPFDSDTMEITHNIKYGVYVPDLSFKREDSERHFTGLRWKLIENIATQSLYNVEHVYFIWRE